MDSKRRGKDLELTTFTADVMSYQYKEITCFDIIVKKNQNKMNAALIAVRDGPLVTKDFLNTGNVADRETTCFINVHGIMGMYNLPMLKPD